MITSEEFLAYVAETVRDELWIDHDAYYYGDDIYIPACVSMWYGSYYEFYIRNAKVELRHSNQNALFKGWTVDPRETEPFTTTRCPHGRSIIFVIRPPTPMTPTNSCIKPAILR